MIEDIRTFTTVVECGSFSAAARILGMSPSAISRQIGGLESRLTVKLFKRSTRQLALTEAGQSFLEGARQLLSDCDNLMSSVQPSNEETQGVLRISVFEGFGRLYICPLIADFLARYPKVEIEMLLDNHIVDMYRDKVDLAIRIGRPVDSRLKTRKLLSNRVLLCASQDYLKRHEAPADPQALREHNCLVLNRGRRLTWWHFARNAERQKVLVKGNLLSEGGTPLLAGARKGLGITALPLWMIGTHLDRGELVTILNDWTLSLYENGSGDIYAVFLDDQYMKPALRALIDFLAAASLQNLSPMR